MYEFLLIFAITVAAAGAILAWIGSWFSRSWSKALGDNAQLIMVYGVLGAFVGVVCLFLIGILGAFLAKHQRVSEFLVAEYTGWQPESLSGRLTLAVGLAVTISIALYVGTICGIVFVQGIIPHSIYFPSGLWAEAYYEASPRFKPFLIQAIAAFAVGALAFDRIHRWRDGSIEASRRRASIVLVNIVGYIMIIGIFSFWFLAAYPQLMDDGVDKILTYALLSIRDTFKFIVHLAAESYSDPAYALRYLWTRLVETGGNLYMISDLYPRVFLITLLIYSVFAIPKLLFDWVTAAEPV